MHMVETVTDAGLAGAKKFPLSHIQHMGAKC